MHPDRNCKQYLLTLFYPFLLFLAGAGHWLVAYRKAEEQEYRRVHRRIKETSKKCEDNKGAGAPRGNTLDGPFLVSHWNLLMWELLTWQKIETSVGDPRQLQFSLVAPVTLRW